MPTWTREPPADARGHGLPLIRTPAARSLTALITSDYLIGTDTHFWGGHTVPCERPECDACEHGVDYRWHGYLSAYNPVDQLHFIFEMTDQAAKVFNEYLKEHGTLRSCQFEAYRWKHRKNGRVIIKCERSAHAPHALPKAPDLEKVMAIIWRIPVDQLKQDGLRSASRRPHLAVDRNGDGQSADPRDYAAPIGPAVDAAATILLDPNLAPKPQPRLVP